MPSVVASTSEGVFASLLEPDSLIVAAYFVAVFTAGAVLARRFATRAPAAEFITGGRTFTWRQTGLTLLAFAVDPNYMGMAGVGFLWGLYLVQWTGVHVWFTSWFAAMFLVPIYWRTHIVTTPEYLERRFNPQCRALFSVLMAIILVVILAAAMYLGAQLIAELLQWRLPFAVAVIATVCTFYVIVGGMRTVLTLDVYQGAILLATLAVVAWRVIDAVGGLGALAALDEPTAADVRVGSVVPPADFRLDSPTMFAAPAILVWATVAGLSWIACNFGMVQRLLATRSERDAQKSLLFLAVLANIACFCTFAIGAGMRHLHPEVMHDRAFIWVMLHMFPVGVRGLLVAGMMAALLSTADGVLTASGTLLTHDIYLRFVQPDADERRVRLVTRLCEAAAMLLALGCIPIVARSASAVGFVQDFFGDLMGVVVALYLTGIFSRRATPRAALAAMIVALGFSFGLHVLGAWHQSHPFSNAALRFVGSLNFAYRGSASFVLAVVLTLLLSHWEPAPDRDRLRNLTVHTLDDVRGPWVGLHAWPGLWRWALGLGVAWFGCSALWEWYGRTH